MKANTTGMQVLFLSQYGQRTASATWWNTIQRHAA